MFRLQKYPPCYALDINIIKKRGGTITDSIKGAKIIERSNEVETNSGFIISKIFDGYEGHRRISNTGKLIEFPVDKVSIGNSISKGLLAGTGYEFNNKHTQPTKYLNGELISEYSFRIIIVSNECMHDIPGAFSNSGNLKTETTFGMRVAHGFREQQYQKLEPRKTKKAIAQSERDYAIAKLIPILEQYKKMYFTEYNPEKVRGNYTEEAGFEHINKLMTQDIINIIKKSMHQRMQ